MTPTIVAGLIGVLGVAAGVFIERLVQRYGKLRFVAGDLTISARIPTEDGVATEPIPSLPADPELLDRSTSVSYSVSVEFFNEKEVKTGLRDVAIVFAGGISGARAELATTPIDRHATRTKRVSTYEVQQSVPVNVVNLSTREWISLDLKGGFHKNDNDAAVRAFSGFERVYLRGYFPDGREFRRELRTGGS